MKPKKIFNLEGLQMFDQLLGHYRVGALHVIYQQY